jgi:hypothetical protein
MRKRESDFGGEHTVSNDGHVTDVRRLLHQGTDLLKSEARVMMLVGGCSSKISGFAQIFIILSGMHSKDLLDHLDGCSLK